MVDHKNVRPFKQMIFRSILEATAFFNLHYILIKKVKFLNIKPLATVVYVILYKFKKFPCPKKNNCSNLFFLSVTVFDDRLQTLGSCVGVASNGCKRLPIFKIKQKNPNFCDIYLVKIYIFYSFLKYSLIFLECHSFRSSFKKERWSMQPISIVVFYFHLKQI